MNMDYFWRCTPWQFYAAVKGWNKSQGNDNGKAPTDAEIDEMLEEHGFA